MSKFCTTSKSSQFSIQIQTLQNFRFRKTTFSQMTTQLITILRKYFISQKFRENLFFQAFGDYKELYRKSLQSSSLSDYGKVLQGPERAMVL